MILKVLLKMPLLSPNQIKSVLRETAKNGTPLEELLRANSLGPEELIEELGSTVRSADSTAMKLKGLEMGFKLNKLLGNNEDGPQVPVVNIIINDVQFELNPILIPR